MRYRPTYEEYIIQGVGYMYVTAVYAKTGVSWYFQPTPTSGFSTTPDFENHDTDTGNLYGFYKVVDSLTFNAFFITDMHPIKKCIFV